MTPVEAARVDLLGAATLLLGELLPPIRVRAAMDVLESAAATYEAAVRADEREKCADVAAEPYGVPIPDAITPGLANAMRAAAREHVALMVERIRARKDE